MQFTNAHKHNASVLDVETHKYGVFADQKIKDDLFRVENMVEKPEPDTLPCNMLVIDRYILTPDIFEILEQIPPGKNREVQITDALLEQAKNGCVLAYKFKGMRFDCGSVEGFIEATNYCYQNIDLTKPTRLSLPNADSVTEANSDTTQMVFNG